MTPLDVLLDRFSVAAKADSRIVAAFLGGSHAAGTADALSDLDLYVIAGDADYASLFADRVALVRHLGAPVVLLDFNAFGFDMLLFVLDDGASGELAFGATSNFRHIHGGPHRVLVDKTGVLRGAEFPLLYEEPVATLRDAIPWFWREAHEMTRALRRGRLHDASAALADMRRHLIRVCRLSVDFAGERRGLPLEAVLPETLNAALAATYPRLAPNDLRDAARAAAGLFADLPVPLAREHGVPYPDGAQRLVMRALDAVS